MELHFSLDEHIIDKQRHWAPQNQTVIQIFKICPKIILNNKKELVMYVMYSEEEPILALIQQQTEGMYY